MRKRQKFNTSFSTEIIQIRSQPRKHFFCPESWTWGRTYLCFMVTISSLLSPRIFSWRLRSLTERVTSSWGSEFKNILHGYLTKKLDHFINKNKTVKRHSFLGTVTIRKLKWLDKFIPRRRCHIGSDSARSALSPCHRRRPRFRWRPCWHRDASGKGRERS